MSYIWLNERIGLEHIKQYPLTSMEFVIGAAIFYNLMIWAFQKYMDTRKERFNWRFATKSHNLLMAIYSGVSAIALFYISYRDGRFETYDTYVCHPPRSEAYYLVCYGFYLSKLWEMFDTVLLIAAKKPVIWLHQIHHTITLGIAAVVWYGSGGMDIIPIGDNLIVHFFMYFYYFDPRRFSSFRRPMTVLQILQFFHVLYYNTIAVLSLPKNNWKVSDCGDHVYIAIFNFSCYGIFLILFINFFIQQYINKKTERKKED